MAGDDLICGTCYATEGLGKGARRKEGDAVAEGFLGEFDLSRAAEVHDGREQEAPRDELISKRDATRWFSRERRSLRYHKGGPEMRAPGQLSCLRAEAELVMWPGVVVGDELKAMLRAAGRFVDTVRLGRREPKS